MTSSEKNKIYVDYYTMAKDWTYSMLLRWHRNLSGINCESARIKRLVICDILYSRGYLRDRDYYPYCIVRGLDKVIGYEEY